MFLLPRKKVKPTVNNLAGPTVAEIEGPKSCWFKIDHVLYQQQDCYYLYCQRAPRICLSNSLAVLLITQGQSRSAHSRTGAGTARGVDLHDKPAQRRDIVLVGMLQLCQKPTPLIL
jgi:hypothetical protein